MFKIYSLGKGLGDCFLIEIGAKPIRILVDGRDGTQNNEIEQILDEIIKYDSKIDIVVVTHIDQDHIKGVIELMKRNEKMFCEVIVVYNYVTKEVISYSQAEEFEKIINNYMVLSTGKKKYPRILQEKIKVLSIDERKNFHIQVEELQKEIPILTLISPDKKGIDSVYEEYKINRPQNKPGNAIKINKNSIVFLLEYTDKCVLFTGDAYLKNIEKIFSASEELDNKVISLIKMPHHGAKENNNGIIEFAKKHKCNKFIVTGEVDWNEQKHPDKDVMIEINDKLTDYVIYTKVNIKDDRIEKNIQSDKEITI